MQMRVGRTERVVFFAKLPSSAFSFLFFSFPFLWAEGNTLSTQPFDVAFRVWPRLHVFNVGIHFTQLLKLISFFFPIT